MMVGRPDPAWKESGVMYGEHWRCQLPADSVKGQRGTCSFFELQLVQYVARQLPALLPRVGRIPDLTYG